MSTNLGDLEELRQIDETLSAINEVFETKIIPVLELHISNLKTISENSTLLTSLVGWDAKTEIDWNRKGYKFPIVKTNIENIAHGPIHSDLELPILIAKQPSSSPKRKQAPLTLPDLKTKIHQ